MQSTLTLPDGWTELAEHRVASTDDLLVNHPVQNQLQVQPAYISISDENTTVHIWRVTTDGFWAAEILEQGEYRASVANNDLHDFIDEIEHVRSHYAFL